MHVSLYRRTAVCHESIYIIISDSVGKRQRATDVCFYGDSILNIQHNINQGISSFTVSSLHLRIEIGFFHRMMVLQIVN